MSLEKFVKAKDYSIRFDPESDLSESVSSPQLHGDDDGLNYAAVKFTDKKPGRQRREQSEEETIYSGVSHQVRM